MKCSVHLCHCCACVGHGLGANVQGHRIVHGWRNSLPMTCNSQGLLYVLGRIVIHNFAMWGKGITFPDLVSSSPHLPKACGNQNCQANVNVLKLSQSSLLIFQMPREGKKTAQDSTVTQSPLSWLCLHFYKNICTSFSFSTKLPQAVTAWDLSCLYTF